MPMTSSELDLIVVELECVDGDPTVRVRARLTGFSARRCTLRMEDETAQLRPNSPVVLRLVDRRAMEIFGLVEWHAGRDLEINITRVNHHEKRYFPREYGGIDVRWKRMDGRRPVTAEAWRRGLHSVDDEEWNTPDPYMNFSASGLRFRDTSPCDEGDTVLIALRPHGQAEWHRAIATVVRRASSLENESAEIAVAFQDIDPASVEALADFTLDRQLAELVRLGLFQE